MGNFGQYSGGSGQPSVIRTEIPGAPAAPDPLKFDPSFLLEMANRRAAAATAAAAPPPRLSRLAPQEAPSERPLVKPKFTPGGAGDPDFEPIYRYADGSYMTGAEAPPGAQGSAQTGFYRRRPGAASGGGTPSVNPNAEDTGKWKGDMDERNARAEGMAQQARRFVPRSEQTGGTSQGSTGMYK